jgi:Replication-relaxation
MAVPIIRRVCIKQYLKRLKELTDHGYVQANATAIKNKDANGRMYYTSRYSYKLSQKGIRYLRHLGIGGAGSVRASNAVDTNYVDIGHALELNDIFIAALRLKYTNPCYYLSRRITGRCFQRNPLWVTYKGVTQRLESDAFLEFRNRSTNSVVALLTDHDRGTEGQAVFQRKIGKYKALLYGQSYQSRLHVGSVTVCFTTFMNVRRMMQIRQWVREALLDAPQLTSMFLFAELPIPLGPRALLFERRWYSLTSDESIAIMGE